MFYWLTLCSWTRERNTTNSSTENKPFASWLCISLFVSHSQCQCHLLHCIHVSYILKPKNILCERSNLAKIKFGFLSQMASRLRGWAENIPCMDGPCSDDTQTLKLRVMNCFFSAGSALPVQLRYIRRMHKHCQELADRSLLKCFLQTSKNA